MASTGHRKKTRYLFSKRYRFLGLNGLRESQSRPNEWMWTIVVRCRRVYSAHSIRSESVCGICRKLKVCKSTQTLIFFFAIAAVATALSTIGLVQWRSSQQFDGFFFTCCLFAVCVSHFIPIDTRMKTENPQKCPLHNSTEDVRCVRPTKNHVIEKTNTQMRWTRMISVLNFSIHSNSLVRVASVQRDVARDSFLFYLWTLVHHFAPISHDSVDGRMLVLRPPLKYPKTKEIKWEMMKMKEEKRQHATLSSLCRLSPLLSWKLSLSAIYDDARSTITLYMIRRRYVNIFKQKKMPRMSHTCINCVHWYRHTHTLDFPSEIPKNEKIKRNASFVVVEWWTNDRPTVSSAKHKLLRGTEKQRNKNLVPSISSLCVYRRLIG